MTETTEAEAPLPAFTHPPARGLRQGFVRVLAERQAPSLGRLAQLPLVGHAARSGAPQISYRVGRPFVRPAWGEKVGCNQPAQRSLSIQREGIRRRWRECVEI